MSALNVGLPTTTQNYIEDIPLGGFTLFPSNLSGIIKLGKQHFVKSGFLIPYEASHHLPLLNKSGGTCIVLGGGSSGTRTTTSISTGPGISLFYVNQSGYVTAACRGWSNGSNLFACAISSNSATDNDGATASLVDICQTSTGQLHTVDGSGNMFLTASGGGNSSSNGTTIGGALGSRTGSNLSTIVNGTNGSGQAYTSTGAGWTLRTASGFGTSENTLAVGWHQAASLFVCISRDNSTNLLKGLYTSSDGYTWTSRTLPTGANTLRVPTGSTNIVGWPSQTIVSSSTTMIISVGTGCFLRSTDAINWTLINTLSSSYLETGGETFGKPQEDVTCIPSLSYLDNTFYACQPTYYSSGAADIANLLYSENDGITWKTAPRPISSWIPLNSGTPGASYQAISPPYLLNGSRYIAVQGIANNLDIIPITGVYHKNPTHVGISMAFYAGYYVAGGGAYHNIYSVRVK